jgi:DNA-binding NarL/FixJ family response regulator
MHIRVLVAEDFPLIREGIVRALRRDPGIEIVAETDNGEDAVRLVLEHEPDVMVLDLRMPGMGGVGVLERLAEESLRTRVLVFTASESPEHVLAAVTAGAAGYISKRTTGEDLRQAVITTHGGGSVIAPELAAHLIRGFSNGRGGAGASMRPLMGGREMEVLRLVSHGMTDNEIGAKLFISPRTVQNHLTNIRDKTGLRRRSELARWAVERAIA